MDDPQMMLVKAKHADLLAQAQRWRTAHGEAERRRASRLVARADRLGAWAERLRREAALLDQRCLRARSAPALGKIPPL